MAQTVTQQEALIYTMVTMSAVDSDMSDDELRKIGDVVRSLPAFDDFDEELLTKVAQACGDIMGGPDGLNEVLDCIAASLPKKLHHTAYALAVEIASADLDVVPEEIRFLALLRDRLNLKKLDISAIEFSAKVRFRRIS